ncbi:MAG: hypothetical protein ACM3XM_18870 [Mycobacterium leprae]
MESWLVIWRDKNDLEQQREFSTYLEAWRYNTDHLGGKAEVILLTDKAATGTYHARTEAEAARRTEGAPRYRRPKK